MTVVTGGNGFIGAHLIVQLLQHDQIVKAFIRPQSSQTFFKKLIRFYNLEHKLHLLEWVEVEIADPFGLETHLTDCHTVYHCAGKVDFSEEAWPDLLIANRDCTRNMVNASIVAKVAKFCLFSSVAALDMSEGIKGKKTDWKHFKKHQPYGYSKYLGELEVYRGHEEGLKVLILNPAVVVGPLPSENPMQVVLNRVSKGISYYPIGSTGYIGVDALVKLAIEETDKLQTKKKITVASHNWTFKEFIEKYCEITQATAPIKPLKGALLQLIFLLARTKISSKINLASIRAISSTSRYEIVPNLPQSLDFSLEESYRFKTYE